MNLLLLFVLCGVGLFAKSSLADEEKEVKRGVYPFMAFVYYSDKNIMDRTGSRLTRGAVLIRPDWLISSSLEDGETSLAFPKETLLARVGAIRIDSKFSFNEDEEEQEREIIQIASPFNYKATEWWVADITLLKTLVPFNISGVVAPVLINAIPKAAKACIILMYFTPNGNRSEDKLLMKLSVDMLPSTPESCGSNFVKSMLCATGGDDMKKESNYCEGNSGSPLICNDEVVGIQIYLNDCKPPYLFQRLTSWDNLITCALENKCHEEQCATICNVINKDPLEFPPQQMLTEAKQYPKENGNHSDEIGAPSSILRRLLPDDFKTISEIDTNKIHNTETTTTTSSTVVYTSEKEIEISSETEIISEVGHAEDKQQQNGESRASVPTSPSYNAETESTQYIYKSEELVSKAEELKNLIEENTSTDTSEAKEPIEKSQDQHSASINTRCSCRLMFGSLILFYLQFSSIVNSF